ncbi:13959_t:CDS:1, partial [Cetraspora pellucida]
LAVTEKGLSMVEVLITNDDLIADEVIAGEVIVDEVIADKVIAGDVIEKEDFLFLTLSPNFAANILAILTGFLVLLDVGFFQRTVKTLISINGF